MSEMVSGEQIESGATDTPDASVTYYLALPVGAQLFEFEILSTLGHGGFGITYLARDQNLDEIVAIKEYMPKTVATRTVDQSVRPQSSEDSESFSSGLTSFLDEARRIARFNHPNITRVRRFFELHGTGYIVLQFERGNTLAQWLKQGRPDEATIRDWTHDLLNGLEAIHQRAMLHRDIKPSNIIIRENDQTPVLIDFGAARDFADRDSRTVTAIATPGYSPPEQYGVDGSQGPWTDFYALGGVLYRCVTGSTPVNSLSRLRHDKLQPARQAAAGDYSDSLLKTIDWMMSVDEVARPQNADAVRDALAGGSAEPQGSGGAPVTEPSITLDAGLGFLLGLPFQRVEDSLKVSFFATPPGSYLQAPSVPANSLQPKATPAAWGESATPFTLDRVQEPTNADVTSYRIPDAISRSLPANATVRVETAVVAPFEYVWPSVAEQQTASKHILQNVYVLAFAPLSILTILLGTVLFFSSSPFTASNQTSQQPPQTQTLPEPSLSQQSPSTQEQGAAPQTDQAQPEPQHETPPVPTPARDQAVSERTCDQSSGLQFDADRPSEQPFLDDTSTLTSDVLEGGIAACTAVAGQTASQRRFYVQAGRLLAENAVRSARGGQTDDARAQMEKAVSAWQAADGAGSGYASNLLGAYFNGTFNRLGGYDFVSPDLQRSVELWRRSMDRGNIVGKRNFAAQLLSGNGITEDIERGLTLLDEAANAGDDRAAGLLGVALYTGYPIGVTKNQSRGWSLLQRSPCSLKEAQSLIRHETSRGRRSDAGMPHCG